MMTTGQTWLFIAQIVMMGVIMVLIALGPRKKADKSEKK